jgi:hypothetical protein
MKRFGKEIIRWVLLLSGISMLIVGIFLIQQYFSINVENDGTPDLLNMNFGSVFAFVGMESTLLVMGLVASGAGLVLIIMAILWRK